MARLTEFEQVMRSTTCTRCGAKPGQPCRTKKGNPATTDHAARYYVARRAGAPALRPADGSDHVTRTHTPPRRNPDGSETYTVQRACNGCGRDIGDATADELDAAVDGATMPDVRDECGCSNPVVQEIAVALCDVEHDWHFPCWQCIQRAAAFASRVRQQTLHDDILWPQPPTLREQDQRDHDVRLLRGGSDD